MDFERTAAGGLKSRLKTLFESKSKKQWIITIAAAGAVLLLLFSIYLGVLFKQLDAAFRQEEHFVPTRLYSDVTRIATPATKAQISARLKALAYSPAVVDGSTIEFTLHPLDYPTSLIPADHPTRGLAGKKIRLTFDGTKNSSTLSTITTGIGDDWSEIPELYLEPELIATLSRADQTAKREIRRIVKFADIPAPIWQAIIAIEDPRFLEHKGLDPRGIARAFWVNLKTASLAQGGSTITAQLVKNLMARRTRNVFLKFNELFLSLILETRYTKEEILERYLNEVYLGQVGSYEVHGVAEGAHLFFGKNMDELNLGENAMMAGLIRGPGFYSPYRYKDRAKERQKLVLKKMVEAGFIAEEEATVAEKQSIRLAPPVTVSNKAPYFTDFVKAEMIRQLKDKISEQDIAAAGFKVYTTLDSQLGSLAQAAVTNGVSALEKKLKLDPAVDTERLEGALATVDHKTGYIRALVGGKSYSASTFNRILNMKRQVGSTFKPFVYLTAFLQGEDANGLAYGAGYPVEDAPWTLSFDSGRQKWTPRNYDKGFLGWIPLRTALAKSINTVAARLGVSVGIPAVIETARALGIQSELPAVPSLTLGVAELSPVELLSAYATIANHGVQDELTVIRAITKSDGGDFATFVYNPKQVYPQPPIDLLIDTMRGTFIEGTAASASAYGFDRPAAGKTGTTSSYRDAWFAGFTPNLTTVVWVGTDQNTSLVEKDEEETLDPKTKKPVKKKRRRVELTGASGALPIWIDFMKQALVGELPTPFPESPHLSEVRIDMRSGHPATLDCAEEQIRTERYMKEHEPRNPECWDHWPESVTELSID